MRRITALVLAALLALSLTACGGSSAAETATDTPVNGVEDGVLTVAMECAYAPYNWTQNDDSNGAVPISNTENLYANGYDVMTAKAICEANGWELEIIQADWDSLIPGIQSGIYDAVIAGQSMTAERAEQVDFAGPYLYASIVCLTKANSPFASAKGIADLAPACRRSKAPTSAPPPRRLPPCSWRWRPTPLISSAPICPQPRAPWPCIPIW